MIDLLDGLPRADDIDTDRVRLRPMRPDDSGALFRVLDDATLHSFMGGVPDKIDELRSRLEVWVAERSVDGREAWLNWVVRAADDGRVLGATQATVEQGRDGLHAVVAWTVGSAYQRRGFASEAARAMVSWLAEQGASRIDAHIHPEHGASAGVARNAGLTPTDDMVDGEVVWRLRAPSSADAG